MEKTVLKVSHISQIGHGANRFNNDCGPACVCMLTNAYTSWGVSVDEVFAKISPVDRCTLVGELINVMSGYGVESSWSANNSITDMFAALVAGKPVIALIDYAPLYDTGLSVVAYRDSHFVVVIGMDIKNVYILDPLQMSSEPMVVPMAVWMKAWTDVGKLDNPALGMITPSLALGETKTQQARVTCGYLNVRSGPGTGYSVIGVLVCNTTVDVMEKKDGWTRHQTGWSFAGYLSEVS